MKSEVKEIKVPVLKMTHKDLMCSDEEEAKEKLKMMCDFLEKVVDMCIEYETIDDGNGTALMVRTFEYVRI